MAKTTKKKVSDEFVFDSKNELIQHLEDAQIDVETVIFENVSTDNFKKDIRWTYNYKV